MYFHPLVLTEAQKQQRIAACEDVARLWLAGVDRQWQLHADAVREFCARQQQHLSALSHASDLTHFLVGWTVRTAPEPFELLQVSMRSGEIAADVQRGIAVVTDRHARELSNGIDGWRADPGTSENVDHGDRAKKPRRRQMMG
jgi:hypothetical protein